MLDTAKVKICLVGDAAVGKSSLIARYVLNEFADSYLVTVGTRVSKKEVDLTIRGRAVTAKLLIWDIMGQEGFRDLIDSSYLKGAQGVLAVADLTRRETLDGLADWLERVRSIAPDARIAILGNKVDLWNSRAFGVAELVMIADNNRATFYMTSAKEGSGVVRAFEEVAADVVRPVILEPWRFETAAPDAAIAR